MCLRGIGVAQNNHTWLRFFVVGTQLAASVLAGLYVGHLVDKWLETETPWFTILGIVVGMASGFVIMLKILETAQNDSENENG